ncbi:MAG TPA: RNA pseudouridine synthase, partial [Clostridiales bacterium]|nr:RNA pseudouridine synthase [Clostridiales bacterium]
MILEEFIVDYRDIEILYEDNHLLVVTKPRNMLSQGDVTGDMDIHTLMKRYIKEKYNKPGNVYLGLVHRLDRPVGGVMVFAKTSKCASRLSAQMREDKFSKGYLAVIEGIPSNTRGELFHYLLKDRRKNVTKVVKEGTKDAKPA